MVVMQVEHGDGGGPRTACWWHNRQPLLVVGESRSYCCWGEENAVGVAGCCTWMGKTQPVLRWLLVGGERMPPVLVEGDKTHWWWLRAHQNDGEVERENDLTDFK